MSQSTFWDDVSDKANLDAGFYRLKIMNIKELERDEKNPHKTFLATFEVEEPREFEGEVHFERYRIGDENDPLGKEKATWKRSMGAKNAKRMLKAANAPFLDTDEAIFEAVKGSEFIGKIVKTPGKGANEGTEFSNMRDYYSLNSREAQFVGQGPYGVQAPYTNGAAVAAGSGQEMECEICHAKVARNEVARHALGHTKAEQPSK